MPSATSSLINLDPKRYQRIEAGAPGSPEPFRPLPAPEAPFAIRRSSLMLSSLPPISTNVDGILRQFYGGPNVPTRRLVSP